MPPIGKIAAHSSYDVLSWYKYLIVNSAFSHLDFRSGNLFLIAPVPNRCLLVPFLIILAATNWLQVADLSLLTGLGDFCCGSIGVDRVYAFRLTIYIFIERYR